MAQRDDKRLNLALVYGEFHPPPPKPQTNARRPVRVDVMQKALEWIRESPHDFHCLMNFPEKDAWRCICGKHQIMDEIEELQRVGATQ